MIVSIYHFVEEQNMKGKYSLDLITCFLSVHSPLVTQSICPLSCLTIYILTQYHAEAVEGSFGRQDHLL